MRASDCLCGQNGTVLPSRSTTQYYLAPTDRYGEKSSYKCRKAVYSYSCSPNDIRVPTSLAFHLSEIYLEELEKALTSSESPPPVPLSTLLLPFIALAARTPTNTTYKHIQSSLFVPLRNLLKSSSGPPSRKKARTSSPDYSKLLVNVCASNSDSDQAMDVDAVRKSILQEIFDVASETETRDANRRRMYAFYKDAVEDDEDEDSAG